MLTRRFACTTLSLSVLGATLLFLVSCGGGAGGAADAGGEDGGPKLSFLETKVRPAPDFTLEAASGEQVKLSDFEGKVRLIDFWATWCAPCREEIPMFKELQATYGPQGFTILAVADDPPNVLRDFLEGKGMDYPNLIDAEGEVNDLYGVKQLPSAYLVDREGRIVEEFFGPKRRKTLEQKIVELLEAKPAA